MVNNISKLLVTGDLYFIKISTGHQTGCLPRFFTGSVFPYIELIEATLCLVASLLLLAKAEILDHNKLPIEMVAIADESIVVCTRWILLAL